MDVDENPPRQPGRWTAAFQLIICCGQLPTQTAIAALLLAFGMVSDVNGQVPLAFFASVTLIDTVVVIALMRLFLRDGGESPMQVFFGPRERPHGPYNLPREAALGLITTPVVLVGAMIVVATIRVLIPGLHNVPVSPFDAFFDTPLRALTFTVVAMVAGGVREELQRGFLLHRFEQQLGGQWLGLAIYSAAFGAFHYTQGWDVAIVTGLLGLFWGWLYIRRRSVAASMVCHAGFNGTQVLQEMVVKMLGAR